MIDVEMLRELMLVLEDRQLSPRQTIIIELYAEAEALTWSPLDLADGLDHLLAIDYIEGPGMDEEGFFLFRKLTRRGLAFLRAARRPRDWDKLKRQYAAIASEA